jgi:hypothetical protein
MEISGYIQIPIDGTMIDHPKAIWPKKHAPNMHLQAS